MFSSNDKIAVVESIDDATGAEWEMSDALANIIAKEGHPIGIMGVPIADPNVKPKKPKRRPKAK